MQAAPARNLSSSRYHVWSPAGHEISIYFERRVMDWIESRAAAALSLSPTGSELTAGLLLGSRTLVHGRTVLVVEGAEPIARSGDVDAQLRRLRTEGALVVGVYRAEARDGSKPVVTPEDSEILEDIAEEGISLVIAADPSFAREPRASVFVRTGGRALPWSEPQPFPFGRPSSVESGDIRVPPVQRRRSRWLAVFALLSLTAAALLWLAYSSGESAQDQGFGLSAEQEGSQWRLHWNTESRSLAKASAVHVVIVDGTVATRYAITPSQVRTGSLLYAPTNGPLSFSMEITDATGKTARETLIVVHHTDKA